MMRKNLNNGQQVDRVVPIGINKVMVFYLNGTSEEMLKSKADQIIREFK